LGLSLWSPKGLLYLDGHLFLKIGKFYAITLLDIFPMPLTCTSSSMHIIHSFGLLMEPQSSCIFCCHLFILFSSSNFSATSILSSSSDILSSTWFSLLIVSIPQSKDIEYCKRKTWPFGAYQKYISLAKADVGLGKKGGKNFQANKLQKQSGVAIVIWWSRLQN
jgi:hypothetical protein